MTNDIDKKNFFKSIDTGQYWHAQRIKDEIDEAIKPKYSHLLLSWRTSDDGDSYFYDTDCFLIVANSKITVRCERENTMSSGKEFDFAVNSKEDIVSAFETFKCMTMEGDDDE